MRKEYMCQVCYYLWEIPGLLNCLSVSHLCLPTDLFLQVFWLNFYMHIILLPCMLFDLPIVSYLFDHHYNIVMNSRNCEASHNAVFPNPLLLISWGPNSLPGILFSVLLYIHTAVLWIMAFYNFVGGCHCSSRILVTSCGKTIGCCSCLLPSCKMPALELSDTSIQVFAWSLVLLLLFLYS